MRIHRACVAVGLILMLTLPASAVHAASLPINAGTTARSSETQRLSGTYDYLCYSPLGRLKTLRASTTRTYSYDALTLQQVLVYLDFPPPVPIKADGWYGPATASAVKAYQRSRHLYVDGIVGPQTWRQLRYDAC